MKQVKITEEQYFVPAKLFGEINGMFTELRVEKNSIPEGVHCYAIRHSDYDWSEPITIEPNLFIINYYGSFITKREIIFHNKDDQFLIINNKDQDNEDLVINTDNCDDSWAMSMPEYLADKTQDSSSYLKSPFIHYQRTTSNI